MGELMKLARLSVVMVAVAVMVMVGVVGVVVVVVAVVVSAGSKQAHWRTGLGLAQSPRRRPRALTPRSSRRTGWRAVSAGRGETTGGLS